VLIITAGFPYPESGVSHSGDGHGLCEPYIYQSCDVSEFLCHKSGEDHPESYMMAVGNRQDLSSPEKL